MITTGFRVTFQIYPPLANQFVTRSSKGMFELTPRKSDSDASYNLSSENPKDEETRTCRNADIMARRSWRAWHRRLAGYETCADVPARLPQPIEQVYNTKRLHSALG